MKKYLLLFATIIAIANLFAQTVVGSHGTAFGFNTTARGDFSTAIGNSTDASGTLSSALGGYIATNYKKGAFAIGDGMAYLNNLGNDADNQMLMRFAGGYKFHLDNSKIAFSINSNGTVGIDQSNQNRGTLSGGLIFGIQSGEGIASNRSGGGNNPWGLDFYAGGINRMVISNGGRVGIGILSPQQLLSIGGGMNIDQNNSNNGTYNPGLTFGSGSGEGIASNRVGGANQYGLDFYGGGINRMCITNGGNVGIGITLPAAKLHVAGNIMASGTITPSDIRYKKNIQPLQDALKKVMSLSGYSYSFKTNEFPDMQFDSKQQIGLIAQDVEKVLPQVVYTTQNGYKGVDYAKIVPLLIEGMKDQQQMIDKQQKQIDELQKIVVALTRK